MASPKSPSPASDISELYDSVFPDSKGSASDAARLRELRRKAHTEGVAVAAHLPLVTPQMLFPSSPAKRPRTKSPDRPSTLNERIDAVKFALSQNKLTTSDFVRKTCAYDYPAQRAKEEPGFRLSSTEAEDAENTRTWAKEIACQEVLREAKQMEAQNPLQTGGKNDAVSFV
jgi:hypothetical protein